MPSIAEEKDDGFVGALPDSARGVCGHRLAQHVGGVVQGLAHRLHPIIDFNYLSVLLYEPARNVMRVHILNSDGWVGYRPPRHEVFRGGVPAGWAGKNQEPNPLHLDAAADRATETQLGRYGPGTDSRNRMRQAMYYSLSLPFSTLIIGCDTIAQLEEKVQLAHREFTPLSQQQMAALTEKAQPVSQQSLFFRFHERA